MAGTVIDLSLIPAPDAIDPLDSEAMIADFKSRFVAFWAAARALDPTLPQYDVETLETDPVMIAAKGFAFQRLLDRARVNDAVRAVLAPLASGADLDNIAARVNIERLEVIPATLTTPAVMETDAQLRHRYFLAFDRTAAGSRDGFLYEAFTAWTGLYDAKVIGRDVHGRLGDVEIVVAGPGGDTPTTQQIGAIRDAVRATDFKPEATGVVVLPATRLTYTASLVIEIPSGPDPSLVIEQTRQRVIEATVERNKIGLSVPAEAISGAAYGPNVIRVRRLSPTTDIAASPYAIPVCTGIQIVAEVIA